MAYGQETTHENISGRPVVVLGMHRSGTSAVTRIINLLGPRICRDDDLLSGPDNPTGHWESASLMAFNDRLLNIFGGTFAAPPLLQEGWEEEGQIAALYEEGRSVFASVHSERTWVWKDPRTCLTLPFWRKVLTEKPVIVYVHREPLEVALSLSRRDGIGKAHCIALWERYSRSALHSSYGLPFLMVRFDELMADTLKAVESIRTNLSALGVVVNKNVAEAVAFVSGDLALNQLRGRSLIDDPDSTGVQHALLEMLSSLPGMSLSFPAYDLGPESASTTELLSAIRQRNDYYPPRFRVAMAEVWPAFRRAASNRLH
jgi:hypothetical protein